MTILDVLVKVAAVCAIPGSVYLFGVWYFSDWLWPWRNLRQ